MMGTSEVVVSNGSAKAEFRVYSAFLSVPWRLLALVASTLASTAVVKFSQPFPEHEAWSPALAEQVMQGLRQDKPTLASAPFPLSSSPVE